MAKSHQNRLAQWRQDHGAFTAKLVELDGEAFKLGTTSEFPEDLSDHIAKIAASVGIEAPEVHTEEDPKGKGPAKFRRTVRGRRSRCSIRRLRNRTQEPKAQAVSPVHHQHPANGRVKFWASDPSRSMGIAQKLYQNRHITYMRTDSPGLSPEAIEMARTLIDQTYGQAYLPDKPRHYAAKSDGAQEAHEAIRPTNAAVEGKNLKSVSEEDRKVYDLIHRRFLASQMTDARWGLLNVRLVRSDQATDARAPGCRSNVGIRWLSQSLWCLRQCG